MLKFPNFSGEIKRVTAHTERRENGAHKRAGKKKKNERQLKKTHRHWPVTYAIYLLTTRCGLTPKIYRVICEMNEVITRSKTGHYLYRTEGENILHLLMWCYFLPVLHQTCNLESICMGKNREKITGCSQCAHSARA